LTFYAEREAMQSVNYSIARNKGNNEKPDQISDKQHQFSALYPLTTTLAS